MAERFGNSELILNPDGSIYHLNLKPEDVAHTIITVGDPGRVGQVSQYFDSIQLKKGKREFITHTGHFNGKRITVISTGIGTDNVDIVFNELDALVNIDFNNKEEKKEKIQLSIIRVGTSGSIQPDIPVDSFLLSKTSVGFDGLLHFYASGHVRNAELEKKLGGLLDWKALNIAPYAVDCDENLASVFDSNRIRYGITVTNSGFYGPQGRMLRLSPKITDFNEVLKSFSFKNMLLTNHEMETSGMYGLAKMHGHRAVSLNAILANRATGEFSKQGYKTVDNLIKYTLEKLTS